MYIQQLFPCAPECPFSPALLVRELRDVGFLEGSVPADCVVADTRTVFRGYTQHCPGRCCWAHHRQGAF